MRTFNLSSYSTTYMDTTYPGVTLAPLLPSATLTIYSGIQPVTADEDVRNDSVALVTITLPNPFYGIVTKNGMITFADIPDDVFDYSGIASFVRCIDENSNVLFDASVGEAEDDTDFLIALKSVLKGQRAKIATNQPVAVGGSFAVAMHR